MKRFQLISIYSTFLISFSIGGVAAAQSIPGFDLNPNIVLSDDKCYLPDGSSCPTSKINPCKRRPKPKTCPQKTLTEFPIGQNAVGFPVQMLGLDTYQKSKIENSYQYQTANTESSTQEEPELDGGCGWVDSEFENSCWFFLAAINSERRGAFLGSGGILGDNGEYILTARHIFGSDAIQTLGSTIRTGLEYGKFPLISENFVGFEDSPETVLHAFSQEIDVMDAEPVSVGNIDLDIVILRLEKPIEMTFDGHTDEVSRRILKYSSDADQSLSKHRILMPGFGENILRYSGLRNWAELEVMTSSCKPDSSAMDCTAYEMAAKSVVTTRYGGLSSPCSGDSGSPLVALTDRDQFGIVGVSSRVATLTARCDGTSESARAIFTNLFDPAVQASIKTAIKNLDKRLSDDEIEKRFFVDADFHPEYLIEKTE